MWNMLKVCQTKKGNTPKSKERERNEGKKNRILLFLVKWFAYHIGSELQFVNYYKGGYKIIV